MEFAIKEKRVEIGMTQEELAQKSGISRATISGLENGYARAVSAITLSKIAKALGTSIDGIVTQS